MPRRLLVVSNRLPVVLEKKQDRWSLKPGSGGLVSALAPVLSHRGGVWIGWPGLTLDEGDGWEKALAEGYRERGYELVPVLLSEDEVKGFYEGFSNAILWPLFHDLLGRCDFEPSFWYAYLEVNRRFAECVLEHSAGDDYIWVQDYQLIHVAHFIREREERRVGFFLHIPFPPLDIFLKLPWRAQILNALLAYDLLGFQTPRDSRNFLTCIQNLLPEAGIEEGPLADVRLGARTIRVGAFPIGIDHEQYDEGARSGEVEARLPELREQVILFQVVVPSREGVPEYQALKAALDQLVGEINGEFSTAGWVPVHYHYRSLSRRDLLALYRMARICFVTSIKDGMNLVAKEFVACQVEGCGVLVLSEFAGAVSQLHEGALVVNPHDIEGMADALREAMEMPEQERRRRMIRMQEIVREQDIFWWVDYYLRAAIGEVPEDIRTPKEYFPPMSIEELWV